MADSREMTFGLDFGLEDSIQMLETVADRLAGITEYAQATETSGQQIGTSFRGAVSDALTGTGELVGALGNVTDSAMDTSDATGQIGAEATAAGSALEGAGAVGGRAMGGLSDLVQSLGLDLGDTADVGTRAMDDVNRSAQNLGQGLADTGAAGTRAMGEVSSAVRNVGPDISEMENSSRAAFRNMGAEASSFGSAVASTMGTALKDGQSAAKGIQAGFQGAIGFTEKKLTGFVGSFTKGAKTIGTAILHPVKTIKDKLGGALIEAGAGVQDVGAQAQSTEKDLQSMGDVGTAAGDAVKNAITKALGAFVGVKAIKKGVDMLKSFVSSALEAAGAAENTGAKFDAMFSGTDAQDWVENFGSAVKRSKTEIQGFLVSNKAMYQEMGITGDAADDLSKITTSLAYDLGAAFSMDDAEALGVMQDYMSGNINALNEYGISIDEAALKQSAMAMGLGANLDALDDAAMAQVRMNTLLENSASIQQAAINNTGGLTNSTKGLKGMWSDFMTDAGAKFIPVIEGLFGAIMDAWPTVEPMLMGLVEVLADGLAQAAPVLIELGGTLIPVLTSVLGTLFQAATPLLSVFGSLAQTILPPVAQIIGMIAGTVMPPLVQILNTLNTAIIQPLVPVIQHLAAALLPPIAQLLGVVSPILEAIAPVLGVIGNVLGVIGDILGKVIGWLADGIGKMTGFFSKLFGGAKESKQEVSELSGAVSDLGAATDSFGSEIDIPVSQIEIPQIEIPPIEPVTFPVEPIEIPQIDIPVSPIEVPAIDVPAADTAAYTTSVTTATTDLQTSTAKTWDSIKDSTGNTLEQIGAQAQDVHEEMADQAESMWRRMVSAAEDGARGVVAAFQNIGTAAASLSGVNITVSGGGAGAQIPHNATGTDYFPGGPTYINEQGGEVAVLPEGSKVIPADKSEKLVEGMAGGGTQQQVTVNLTVNINFTGDAGDESDRRSLTEEIEATVKKLYQELQQNDYDERALNGAYA